MLRRQPDRWGVQSGEYGKQCSHRSRARADGSLFETRLHLTRNTESPETICTAYSWRWFVFNIQAGCFSSDRGSTRKASVSFMEHTGRHRRLALQGLSCVIGAQTVLCVQGSFGDNSVPCSQVSRHLPFSCWNRNSMFQSLLPKD